jgi:peptide/nickel transport system substrate-binding protein
MSQTKKVSRREFLRLSAVGAAGVVLAACAQETAAPVVETKPTEAPKAAEATPTQRVLVQDTPTPVPTAEAQSVEPPVLQAKVDSGELPPLVDRLPTVPLTLSPVDTIGKYGGRLKMASWWQDGGIEAKQYGHSAIRFVDDGLGLAPGHIESWSANADNSVWTLKFREGLKWSDGSPCTTADVKYWWDDCVLDPDHPDLPPSEFSAIDGVLPEFNAVDDYTLELKYVKPAPLTAKRLAMWVNGSIGPRWISPAAYLKKFNPKYGPDGKKGAMGANPDYPDYVEHDRKRNTQNNPECPSLNAWKLVAYEQGVSSTYDRNPYYYCVDTAGNQLPYIDGIDDKPSPDAQYLLLQILQGSVEYEVHTYQLTLGDVSSLKEGQDKGNYDVRFWDTGSGTGMMYFWNYDVKDDKKRELYRNPKFKQAVSFAIDRPTIKRIVYYDTGILTTGTMSPKAFEFNFNADAQAHYEKFRSLCVDYDPDKAKALLDEIGMKDVDGDGFREMPDGSKFEFKVDLGADAAGESVKVLEITSKNWKDVGLNVVINSIPPSDFGPSWRAGQLDFRTAWEVGDGPDHLLYPSWVVPDETERWAPLCGQLRIVKGTELENTEADVVPWDRQPPRFNVNDPQYKGTPIEKLHALYDQAIFEVDDIKRMELVWQMNDIHMADGPFFLGTVCNTPRIIIVSKNLDNVPTRDQLKLGGFCNPWIIPTPAVTNPETMSFKNV